MGRGPCAFRSTDLKRALHAANKANFPIGRVEIDRDGRILLFPTGEAKPADDLDAELEAFQKQHAG